MSELKITPASSTKDMLFDEILSSHEGNLDVLYLLIWM